jgi:hypothetical protein
MPRILFVLLFLLPVVGSAWGKTPVPGTSKSKSPAVEQLRGEAKRLGPIAAGHFRAMVIEASAKISHHDFSARAEAEQYANDAVSESDDNPPIACVFDHKLQLVHQGAAPR